MTRLFFSSCFGGSQIISGPCFCQVEAVPFAPGVPALTWLIGRRASSSTETNLMRLRRKETEHPPAGLLYHETLWSKVAGEGGFGRHLERVSLEQGDFQSPWAWNRSGNLLTARGAPSNGLG